MTRPWLIGRWRALVELALLRAGHPHVEADDLLALAGEMARESAPVDDLAGRSVFGALRWAAQGYAQAAADSPLRHEMAPVLTGLAEVARWQMPFEILSRPVSGSMAQAAPPLRRHRADIDD